MPRSVCTAVHHRTAWDPQCHQLKSWVRCPKGYSRISIRSFPKAIWNPCVIRPQSMISSLICLTLTTINHSSWQHPPWVCAVSFRSGVSRWQSMCELVSPFVPYSSLTDKIWFFSFVLISRRSRRYVNDDSIHMRHKDWFLLFRIAWDHCFHSQPCLSAWNFLRFCLRVVVVCVYRCSTVFARWEDLSFTFYSNQ